MWSFNEMLFRIKRQIQSSRLAMAKARNFVDGPTVDDLFEVSIGNAQEDEFSKQTVDLYETAHANMEATHTMGPNQ